MTNDEMPELKVPPLMPRFGLGDIVTVVGEYEIDWGGQKLMITGIDYRPKQDLITYQTHLAEAPESEGGTDGWTENDLSLYQYNKWNTRSTPAAVPPAADIPNCEHGYAYNDCPFYKCTHWDMGI